MSFIQDVVYPAGNYASPQTVTLSSNVTAGHTLLIAIIGGSNITSTHIPTCSDTNGDTFDLVGTTAGFGSTSGIILYTVQSAVGGATSVVVTPAGADFSRVYIAEYSSLGSLIAVTANWQNGANSGANTIVSGTLAIPSTALLWGITLNDNYTELPTAGTSPISFTGRTAGDYYLPEDASVSGNSQCTWGHSTTAPYLTLAAAFGAKPVIGLVQISAPGTFLGTASATTTLSGVTAGNTIIAVISHVDTLGGAPTFTLADGQGTYAQDAFAKNIANGAAGALIGSLFNATSGTHVLTATASSDATTSQGFLIAAEFAGLANGRDQTSTATGDSQTPSTTPTGSLANTNEVVIAALSYYAAGAGGTFPPTGGPGTFVELFNSAVNPTYDGDYQIVSGSNAPVSVSWGTFTTGAKWAAALVTYQAASSTIGSTQFLGPGISPVKRLIFQTRNLSSQTIPSGAISARGYSKSYGFAPVGQQSNASAKGYSKSYGFARSSGPQSYFAELFRGPGISSDWPQTFLLRNLATTQSSGISSYISAVGYSKSYGRATSGSGAASARGFSKSYGRARVNGVTSLYATGYSLGYGFGNGFGVSLGYSNATGYSKGYGRAQFGPQTILMPNVLGDTQANAETILQNLGLSVNVGDSNSLITPPGIVMAQFPIAGTLVTVGQLVSITVSIGPFVRAANPNLGYKVTARVFSLEAMASQAWGSEFRAPDHRVYQWSNGRGFDSTDLGTTGIYQKGTSTS